MVDIHYNSGLKPLKNKNPYYNWGITDNSCDVPKDEINKKCPDEISKNPAENIEQSPTNPCYKKIQSEVSKNAELRKNANNKNIDVCIRELNKNLRCSNDTSYLNCQNSFIKDSIIKEECKTQDIALENIVNYCVNMTVNPADKSKDICNKTYNVNRPELKNLSKTTIIDNLDKNINCRDNCNLHKLKIDDIPKYTYKNNLDNTENNLDCNQMTKLLYNCEQLKSNSPDFEKYYHDFVKEGKFDYDKVMNDNPKVLDTLLKYSMCKMASDNLDIISGTKIDLSLTTWWHLNIFNNRGIIKDDNEIVHKNGFQRNIFYISFFIVLFLKLTILSKFNIIPGKTTYLNKVLPMMTIIFSLVILYGFINNHNWIATLAHIVFLVFIIAIISGFGFYIKDKIWSKDESNRQILALLLVVGCIILFTKGIFGPSDNNIFISVSIISYFIFISAYIILKSEKSTIIFKMISILIISLLLIIYLFYSKDLLFNVVYFYIFVFIILIFIICTNNTDLFSKKFNGNNVSKYVKIINIVLKPFKETNKMSSNEKIIKFLVLGFYFLFAFADSFISVLSPQVALVIMIVFRLILNRWFEPINAIFASLSGYSMSNIEGTHEKLTTTNSGILDIENLLSFFIK